MPLLVVPPIKQLLFPMMRIRTEANEKNCFFIDYRRLRNSGHGVRRIGCLVDQPIPESDKDIHVLPYLKSSNESALILRQKDLG